MNYSSEIISLLRQAEVDLNRREWKELLEGLYDEIEYRLDVVDRKD